MIQTHTSIELHRVDGISVPLYPGATVCCVHDVSSYGTIVAMGENDQVKVLWSIVPARKVRNLCAESSSFTSASWKTSPNVRLIDTSKICFKR